MNLIKFWCVQIRVSQDIWGHLFQIHYIQGNSYVSKIHRQISFAFLPSRFPYSHILFVYLVCQIHANFTRHMYKCSSVISMYLRYIDKYRSFSLHLARHIHILLVYLVSQIHVNYVVCNMYTYI